MKDFPSLSVETGRHAAEWVVNGRAIPGELEVESGRPPRLTFFDEVKPMVWQTEGGTRSAGFPQNHQIPEIVGQLRSGQDVIVTDVLASILVPGRSSGFGRYAVVGLGIAEAAKSGYERVRLQITGADMLFGIPPIESVSFPDPSAKGFRGSYSAALNPASSQHWEDPSRAIVIDCSYEGSFALTNTYRHELAFAPVVEFAGDPMTVDDWMTLWVRPFLGLAALATRAPQRLAWLTVHASRSEQDAPAESPSGVLFGSGIDQAPFQAEYPPEWRDPKRRPLFTLKSLPVGLPTVLGSWRDLEADQNPFLDLYRSALFQIDLPLRARFLYLVQALEALHASESRSEDMKKQARFEQRRESILRELVGTSVAPTTIRYIKDHWGRKRPDSLDRRLAGLLGAIPSVVRDDLERLAMTSSSLFIASEGTLTLEGKIRTLRNDLSHGTRIFEEQDLRPWVRVVEVMCQVHVMRLLGFGAAVIEDSLAER